MLITEEHNNLSLAANCEDGDIKLVPDSQGKAGMVFVCINKRWGPIQNNYNYFEEENIRKTMCTQMGYTITYTDGKRCF